MFFSETLPLALLLDLLFLLDGLTSVFLRETLPPGLSSNLLFPTDGLKSIFLSVVLASVLSAGLLFMLDGLTSVFLSEALPPVPSPNLLFPPDSLTSIFFSEALPLVLSFIPELLLRLGPSLIAGKITRIFLLRRDLIYKNVWDSIHELNFSMRFSQDNEKKNASKNVFKTHKETKKTRAGWINGWKPQRSEKIVLIGNTRKCSKTAKQLRVSFSKASVFLFWLIFGWDEWKIVACF